MSSLPYHEPDIITLLTQSSFLLLLNIIDYLLNHALYCGLLGQVLLGIAFGAPGGNLLSYQAQEIIVQLGYIGLILLVYEGGLSVPLTSLKANIGLSIGVAVTGIVVPIGLSFVLQPLLDASPLQAFAAGAALCSTSLGTTFTVLSTSGLTNTRLGSVLSTAAMMDDVVGLVMVQVISNFGSSSNMVDPVTVVRPIVVSLGFAIVVPLLCRYVVRPVRRALHGKTFAYKVRAIFAYRRARFVLHSIFLFGLVAAASYSGTSVLFAAYLSGAIVNWWDSEPAMAPTTSGAVSEPVVGNITGGNAVGGRAEGMAGKDVATSGIPVSSADAGIDLNGLSGMSTYQSYLSQPVARLLRPFFFASIGFSIPISDLFQGAVLWRGVVYTLLMIVGKLVCGTWLVRLLRLSGTSISGTPLFTRFRRRLAMKLLRRKSPEEKETPRPQEKSESAAQSRGSPTPIEGVESESEPNQPSTPHEAPVSLYPGAILGCAMVSRGEIGFLISSVAESQGIWRKRGTEASGQSTESSSDIFVIVTWAILLCTFIGPIAVGLIVRRLKRLKRAAEPGRRNVLGSWGVD